MTLKELKIKRRERLDLIASGAVTRVFGTTSYIELTPAIKEGEGEGVAASIVIFTDICFANLLPELGMKYPQELIDNERTWNGDYDEVIGSRPDFVRFIPAKNFTEAFSKLAENPDAFAEWVDETFESY